MKTKIEKFLQRKRRTRSKISGSASVPRLSVFRSNKYLSAQIIDDARGKTLVAVTSREIKEDLPRVAKALLLGELLAKKATALKIKKCVFDKGGYKYHGSIKSLADGARKGGIQI